MSFKSRLARLEKTAVVKQAADAEWLRRAAEEHDRREAAWAIMQQTMSEEHARLVVETFAAGGSSWDSPLRNTPGGRLLRHCLGALDGRKQRHWPYSDIPPEVFLAMPPALAEVFLEQEALRLHECEDCGFDLPFGHFPSCPLCGGRIGWYAYYNRRKAEADAAEE